ncbi:MAG: acyl-CoA dehydrogenase [Spirochaetae bacterium HGW-Spirochaetae-1]|jgi:acyl-CoA dehydrogenase|nr:MAG: acyl-CoA dehydrogenase [Spirochaetae bacterium HGW-Spirochaetae-1]
MLNFSLSPEQLDLQKKARDFAIKEILPVAWYYDEKDKIPREILNKAFEAGLMNSDIPVMYGGKGMGLVEGAIVTEEISAACPGLATSIFDNSLGMEPIILSNREEIKKKYLPLIARQGKLICFATSEPTMGSDVAGIRCRAEKKSDEYILNGTKYWITNAGVADYMTVFATVDPKQKHGGICAFVVHREWEGVTVGRDIPKMGQRTSNTAAWNFKNVVVPMENVLADPGEGFALAMKTFARTRPIIGAFAVGAARSAMEYAIDYAKRRQAFGSKISNFQAIQHKIAAMYQKVETSRLLVHKAAWESDQGIDPTVNASLAKFYATESAMEVVSDALQIMGGYGYTKMYPLEKLFRDTRLLMIYEGTSEVQRVIVSGHALNSYKPAMPPLEEIPIIRDTDLLGEGKDGAILWRCSMCGYIHEGSEAPEECPICFMPKGAFKKVNP